MELCPTGKIEAKENRTENKLSWELDQQEKPISDAHKRGHKAKTQPRATTSAVSDACYRCMGKARTS